MVVTDLTPSERDALSFLEETAEEQLAFARELIATPSPNPPGGETAVAAVVTERLERLGITDITELARSPERPNLVARVPGAGDGSTLLLSGHLDTKPAGDMVRWETDPWDPVIRDGNLHGLGSGDMKVAVAAMVYAGAAVSRSAGWSGELQLVFTADEEAGSNLGSKWMAEEGHLRGDAAIIGEPCGVVEEWEKHRGGVEGRRPGEDRGGRDPDALQRLRPFQSHQRHGRDGLANPAYAFGDERVPDLRAAPPGEDPGRPSTSA